MGDILRGKALALLMEKATITDASGNVRSTSTPSTRRPVTSSGAQDEPVEVAAADADGDAADEAPTPPEGDEVPSRGGHRRALSEHRPRCGRVRRPLRLVS